ncbi:MAG: hypothetical protein KGH59_02015 [Candidatus Micrarchaeota archaeon]|nr:hypothetical protein [Candidatus Micrarchaeota archaeon]MDE1804539.1 hypothetical protein [Candidatus Micrarchaeota archaeon]
MIRKTRDNTEERREAAGMIGIAVLSSAMVAADVYSLGGTYVSWGATAAAFLSLGRGMQLLRSIKRS